MFAQVADRVYRLARGIANFYLVEDGGKLILVDAGRPKDWDLFGQAVQALGHRVDDLDAVLLSMRTPTIPALLSGHGPRSVRASWCTDLTRRWPGPAKPPPRSSAM